MIPDAVQVVARMTDTKALPLSVQGLAAEIQTGEVTRSTVARMAQFHAFSDGESNDVVLAHGGVPGAWWAALQAPALPPSTRTPEVDDWVINQFCSLPAEVFAAAAVPGSTRPTILREYDKAAEALDDKAVERLHQIMMDVLAELYRKAGLKVMACLKDPVVKAAFSHVPLPEVPSLAMETELRPGRTVWAVTNLDVQKLISRAVEELERRLRTAMEDLDGAAVGLYRRVFGTDVGTPDPGRHRDAVAYAVDRFVQIAQTKLDPEPGSGLDDEPVLGETARAAIGVGLITQIMMRLTGGSVGSDGLVVTGVGPTVAPSVAKQSALAEANRAALRDAGAKLIERRRLLELELEELRKQIAGTRAAAKEATEAVRKLEKSGEAYRAAKARQAEARKAFERSRKAKEGFAKKAKAELEREARNVGVKPEARPVAENLANGRVEMQTTTRWVWAIESVPSNPFQPHVDMDGLEVGSHEWETARKAALRYTLKDGTARATEPFALGVWFPGDHDGCSCGYRTTTVLVPQTT